MNLVFKSANGEKLPKHATLFFTHSYQPYEVEIFKSELTLKLEKAGAVWIRVSAGGLGKLLKVLSEMQVKIQYLTLKAKLDRKLPEVVFWILVTL